MGLSLPHERAPARQTITEPPAGEVKVLLDFSDESTLTAATAAG